MVESHGRIGKCGLHPAQSRGRKHAELPHPLRGPFERDRDRIVHSGAFRRLIAKTQVFVGQPDDLQRTRLTHTLEVAQIARTIARQLGLNEDLTEAIALAHDLGHPPFGHSGERALAQRMREHGGFEHNRQSVRVLETLEHPYPEFAGLNLSLEVLECLALRSHEEHPDLRELRVNRTMWLEGQTVDAADSIAYNAHDVQDGLRAGLIERSELQGLPLWQQSVECARRRHRELGMGQTQDATVVRAMLDLLVRNVVESSTGRLDDVADALDARRHGGTLVRLDEELERSKAELANFLGVRVYRSERVLRTTRAAEKLIGELFDALVCDPWTMPESFRSRLEIDSTPRVVCDFIACMTDRYAQSYWSRIFEPAIDGNESN